MTHRFNKPITGRRATIARFVIGTSIVAWLLVAGIAIVQIAGEGKARPIELMAVQPVNLQLQDHARHPVAAAIPAQHVGSAQVQSVIGESVDDVTAEEIATVQKQPVIEQTISIVAQPEGPSFDDRPLRKVRTIEMKVTAYSPDERSCGKWADGVTASGKSVWTNGMKLVAADTSMLPFNTILTIDGYNAGKPVQVLDRGGAIKGNRLDVLYPTHEEAMKWGVRIIKVDVWEYAD